LAKSSIDQYRKSSVSSASPLQLVIMLYDGALRFMEAGKHAMQKRDVFVQNENITKAERIISELLSTLDMEQGGEVAANLFSIYTYVYDKLVEANIEDKPELIDECTTILSELRESWVELERLTRTSALVEASDAA
jgi:flagellar protein FliS